MKAREQEDCPKLIYQPESLDQPRRHAFETALDRDRARILYMGSDGTQDYVIVEATSFEHTRNWSRQAGVPLVFTRAQGLNPTVQHERRGTGA